MISMPANGMYIMASGISLGNGRYNKKEDMNMVFYFTATGNSLYVAKYFSEHPVSIPQIMQGTRRQFADDSIGIICPVYAGQPPKLVLRFLQESDFQTDYFYIIRTYGHDQKMCIRDSWMGMEDGPRLKVCPGISGMCRGPKMWK